MATADFRIAAAQVAFVRGDIVGNIAAHTAVIEAAAAQGVAVLIFPELSLTGYEPDLAAELAIAPTDERLVPLTTLARRHQIDVVVGAPLRNGTAKPNLGAMLFAADGTTRTYSKMYLGASERTYFTPGSEPLAFSARGHTIGIAICADASQPSHPRAYAEAGSTIYAAGVFLNADWYATDAPRLAGYAADCRMLANHADSVGTYRSVGKSAVWAPGGTRLAQADGAESCLVIATSGPGAWRGEVVGV
jgi:predicted amidohydrolase